MFGEKKASARELKALSARVDALVAAHDEVVDWLAKELGLCLRESNYWHDGWSLIPSPVSPRRFALKPQNLPEPELARCPEGRKK